MEILGEQAPDPFDLQGFEAHGLCFPGLCNKGGIQPGKLLLIVASTWVSITL